MRGRELISLPVINMEDNQIFGEIKDIIYQPETSQVVAVIVEDGGWIRGAKIIEYQDIAQIRKDGVLINGVDLIKDTSDCETAKTLWKERKSIFGYKILTTNGEDLGTVEDVIIDPISGEIVEYEVSQGVISDLISGRTNVQVPNNFTLGENSIIVADS